MDSLAKHIRMENDPWFQKGREEATRNFVLALFQNTAFDAPKIATVAGVFVEEVKKGLG